MEIKSDLVQQLTEIGFFAAGRGLQQQATVIFNALAAARPESATPLIGLAVAKMNADGASEAVTLLQDEALRIQPDNEIAKSFLAVALRLAGRSTESARVCQDVLDHGTDEQALNIAKSLLDAPA